MIAAARIEVSRAYRTDIAAMHILSDAHLCPAYAAQHRRLVPLRARPDFNRMRFHRIVAFLARKVAATTPHFDCDYIQRGVIVHAARLRIQTNAEYPRRLFLHAYSVRPPAQPSTKREWGTYYGEIQYVMANLLPDQLYTAVARASFERIVWPHRTRCAESIRQQPVTGNVVFAHQGLLHRGGAPL